MRAALYEALCIEADHRFPMFSVGDWTVEKIEIDAPTDAPGEEESDGE